MSVLLKRRWGGGGGGVGGGVVITLPTSLTPLDMKGGWLKVTG